MSVAAQVESKIQSLGEDRIFTYRDFQDLGKFQTVALALSRLKQRGRIKRLSKGAYFVPKKSRFGTMDPSDRDVMSKIIEKNGGYFAGAGALNRMGISTQIPSELVVAGSRSSRKLKVGNLRIRFVKEGSKDATAEDSKLTDILEALRVIRRIPASEIPSVFSKIKSNLGELSEQELSKLIKISTSYRPYVRALLGALLESQGSSSSIQLRRGLNPLSQYKLNLSVGVLPNAKSWRIA